MSPWKTGCGSLLLVGALGLLGAIIGAIVGLVRVQQAWPPWQSVMLPAAPEHPTALMALDFYSAHYEDPTHDTLYITGASGNLYAFAAAQNTWQSATTLPNPQTSVPHTSMLNPHCKTAWGDSPPPTATALDSLSISFRHIFIISDRCYVLLANGSIQRWARELNLFTLFNLGFDSIFFGLAAGIILGILNHFFRGPGKHIQV